MLMTLFTRLFGLKHLICSSLLLLLLPYLSACNTGFGEPCQLPQTANVNKACNPPVSTVPEEEQDNENQTTQELKTSCAIENYPTCETQTCMIYRNSSPFCTMKCNTDSECEGGFCCPLFGDCNTETAASCTEGTNVCYCIRKTDKE
jgi:hypothetical protein